MVKHKNANFAISAPCNDVPILLVHRNCPDTPWVVDRLDDISLPMPYFNSIIITSAHKNEPEHAHCHWPNGENKSRMAKEGL